MINKRKDKIMGNSDRIDLTVNLSKKTYMKIATLAEAEGQDFQFFMRHLILRGILDVEAQRAHRKAGDYGT
jgi:hypothetical protein